MSVNKQAFAKVSRKQSQSLPFSLKYEWWNEVVQNNWDVAIVEENGETKAVWPYYMRSKGPFKMLCQPAFTPYGGPIFDYPDGQKIERRYSFEQKLSEQIIQALPAFSELEINCRIDLKNTLPFIWANFEDRKKFTYLLDLKQTEEEIWTNFRENIRRQIRKAEKRLTIRKSEDPALLDRMLRSTFEVQSAEYPIKDTGVYHRILKYIHKYKCGELLEAIDEDQNEHACILWIHDDHAAYYLIGGANQAFKNSGAMSLLIWQAIKDSQSVRLEQKESLSHFNFEGSMIPTIEKYLRGFGGELTPYSCLYKNQSLGLKLARTLI
jgi:hypothetical protein